MSQQSRVTLLPPIASLKDVKLPEAQTLDRIVASEAALEISEAQLVDLMRQLGRTQEEIEAIERDIAVGQKVYIQIAGVDARYGECQWEDGSCGNTLRMYGSMTRLQQIQKYLLDAPEAQPTWHAQADNLAERGTHLA